MSAQVFSTQEVDIIQAHLDTMIASPHFATTARLRALLRFTAEKALSGDLAALKESVIAADVYQRHKDYDPQIHSTVRVDFGRLRQRLRDYYAGQGIGDPVRVIISKGSYVPQFEFRPSGTRPQDLSRTATRRRLLRAGSAAAALSLAAVAAKRWIPSRNMRSALHLATGMEARLAQDAAFLKEALYAAGWSVLPSWNHRDRPETIVLLGAGDEDERRYAAASLYTETYEFPTRTLHFDFPGTSDLRIRGASVVAEIRRNVMALAQTHPRALQRERKRSVEGCRRIWRERSGQPDFTLQQDDPRLPLPKIIETIAELTRLAAVDPDFAGTHAELAWAYRLAADHDPNLYEKVKSEAQLAVRLDPDLGMGHFALGYVNFFREWDFRAAMDRWLPASLSAPQRVQWYRYSADAAMVLGKYAEAEKQLERGLAFLPEHAVLLASRTRLDLYRRDYRSMERRARKLVSLHPGLHTGHLLLGKAALLQGRLAEAEAHIRSSGAPQHVSTVSALARVMAYRGNAAGASAALGSAQLARLHAVRGAVFAALGDRRAAEEAFEKSRSSRDPNFPYMLMEPDPALDQSKWVLEAAAALGVFRTAPGKNGRAAAVAARL